MRGRDLRDLETMLRHGARAEPPAHLLARIGQDIPGELPEARRARGGGAAPLLAAAGLAAMLVLGLLVAPRGGPRQEALPGIERGGLVPTSPEPLPSLHRLPRPEPLAATPPLAPDASYDGGRRRDPYSAAAPVAGARPVPTIAELELTGIVSAGDERIALLAAADGRSFQLRVGDLVADGMVRTIGVGEVGFARKVNDPLSVKTFIEVVKRLPEQHR